MVNWTRRFLCILSGDDYGIIAQCRIERQNRFAFIGFFVLLIFVLCFLSCYVTFTKLFQSYLIGIPAGLFFSFMITNLYLLILYTLTKNVLPHSMSKWAMFFSIGLRVIFVSFIAIIVSKPFEVLVFSDRLDSDIALYKMQQLENFRETTSQYFAGESQAIQSIINNIQAAPGTSDTLKLERYQKLLDQKMDEEIRLMSRMRSLVRESNYYVRSIVILNSKYPECWLLTAVVVLVFTLPLYVKRIIPISGSFYSQKKDYEIALIRQGYEDFKDQYRKLFVTNFELEIPYENQWEDAPFNTRRRKDSRKFKPESALISELYHD